MVELISEMPLLFFYLGVWIVTLGYNIFANPFIKTKDEETLGLAKINLDPLIAGLKILAGFVSFGVLILLRSMYVLRVFDGTDVLFFELVHLKPFLTGVFVLQTIWLPFSIFLFVMGIYQMKKDY